MGSKAGSCDGEGNDGARAVADLADTQVRNDAADRGALYLATPEQVVLVATRALGAAKAANQQNRYPRSDNQGQEASARIQPLNQCMHNWYSLRAIPFFLDAEPCGERCLSLNREPVKLMLISLALLRLKPPLRKGKERAKILAEWNGRPIP